MNNQPQKTLIAKLHCSNRPECYSALITPDLVIQDVYNIESVSLVEVWVLDEQDLTMYTDHQGRRYEQGRVPDPKYGMSSTVFTMYPDKPAGLLIQDPVYYMPLELLCQELMGAMDSMADFGCTEQVSTLENILEMIRTTLLRDYPAYRLVETPVVPGVANLGIDGTDIESTQLKLVHALGDNPMKMKETKGDLA